MASFVLNGRPWPRRVAVTALFVGLAVINSYPLAMSPDGAIGQHGDAFFSVWRLAWVAHQLRTDAVRLFDANIFFPESNTLAYSDAMLLPALVVAPFNWLGVSPLLIYNLTLLAAFVLSGLAAYALVRRLTGSVVAGLLGGIIFAFSPHRLEHFDHLELQFAFWIPLAALAWHRAIERGNARGYLWVSTLAAAQVLSSIYHGLFLLTWLAVMTVAWFYREPRKAAGATSLIVLPAAVVLALYSLPYLSSRAAVGERPRSEVATYSARPMDFLSSPANNRLYGWTADLGANERHLFPGALAATLLLVGLSRCRDRQVRIHGVGLALAIVLTLGFNGGLYTVLYDWVLPFRGLRVPARAGILVLLGTSVFAGAGLLWLLGQRPLTRARTLVAAVALAAVSTEYLAAPSLIAVNSTVSPWYAHLRTIPDAVVFEWPVTVPWRLHIMEDVRYMFHSTTHWRPLLNGYSGNYPRSYLELLYEMRSFPYTPALRYLRKRGATVLVLHERAGTRPSYQAAMERLHRDPTVSLIAQTQEDGARIAFFRLLDAVPRQTARGQRAVGP